MVPSSQVDPRPSRWPLPRHFAWLAVAWGLLVLYGSLTPFDFHARDWQEAVRILRAISRGPLLVGSRGDWLINVLILVPFGFAALGALLLDRDRLPRRIAAVLLVLAAGVALSVGVEAAQLWFRERYPAKADVIAQTLGNVVGMGLWVLAGQAATDWTRRHLHGPPESRAFWLLAVYAVGLVAWSLLPLDVTLRPGELWDKWKAGRIGIVPFAGATGSFAGLYALVRDAAVWLPIGVLAAHLRMPGNGPAMRFAGRWLCGTALVAAIELLQVFVVSRYADVTDLILGSAGVLVGLALAASWPRGEVGLPQRREIALACLAVYAVFLAALYLEPFTLAADALAAQARLAAMVRVPLEALRHGEPLGIISNVFRKLALFGVLGWLAAESLWGPSSGRGRGAWGAVCGLAAAAAIEIAQAWFPPHVPDLTDVFWGGLGGYLGASLAPWLRK